MKNLKAWIKRCKRAEKQLSLSSDLSKAYREAEKLLKYKCPCCNYPKCGHNHAFMGTSNPVKEKDNG